MYRDFGWKKRPTVIVDHFGGIPNKGDAGYREHAVLTGYLWESRRENRAMSMGFDHRDMPTAEKSERGPRLPCVLASPCRLASRSQTGQNCIHTTSMQAWDLLPKAVQDRSSRCECIFLPLKQPSLHFRAHPAALSKLILIRGFVPSICTTYEPPLYISYILLSDTNHLDTSIPHYHPLLCMLINTKTIAHLEHPPVEPLSEGGHCKRGCIRLGLPSLAAT
ncbi:hypothetical protein ACRALDRAFT_206958 [Sodiomyces alcalophilus JCM 7366]|uniref:uncharacterized protein n=1 Tax=Sodiomyces alcalophilus JCM 7366 TaxID=591952 RepID=UPI0039B62B8E